MVEIVISLLLFFVAGLFEIGGGYLSLDKRKKKGICCFFWIIIIIFIWYSSHISIFTFWKNICCLWWYFYNFFNNFGKNS